MQKDPGPGKPSGLPQQEKELPLRSSSQSKGAQTPLGRIDVTPRKPHCFKGSATLSWSPTNLKSG